MSAIDNVIFFYRLLNITAITSLIDGKVWRYNRPVNSKKTDVIISSPEYIGGAFNKANIEINVHVPNIPMTIDGTPDPTHPNVVKLQQITNAITALLSGYNFTVVGKVLRDKDNQNWYSNNIIEITQIDPVRGLPVEIYDLIAQADGYGGVTATRELAWSGRAVMVDVKKGSQVNTDNNSYAYHQVNDFILPVIPQKNQKVVTSEGEYAILGITPEGSDLWRVNAYRGDFKRA